MMRLFLLTLALVSTTIVTASPFCLGTIPAYSNIDGSAITKSCSSFYDDELSCGLDVLCEWYPLTLADKVVISMTTLSLFFILLMFYYMGWQLYFLRREIKQLQDNLAKHSVGTASANRDDPEAQEQPAAAAPPPQNKD